MCTFQRLETAIRAYQQAHSAAPQPSDVLATGFWIMVHGLSALLISERLTTTKLEGKTVDEISQQFLNILYRGLLT